MKLDLLLKRASDLRAALAMRNGLSGREELEPSAEAVLMVMNEQCLEMLTRMQSIERRLAKLESRSRRNEKSKTVIEG